MAGREAIPDLREMLKDQDRVVRQATQEALEALVTEDDLGWLAEWAARYSLAGTGQETLNLLIHLDRKLYCPFEWSEELRARESAE